jgi:SMODS-associating 4TM effector domain
MAVRLDPSEPSLDGNIGDYMSVTTPSNFEAQNTRYARRYVAAQARTYSDAKVVFSIIVIVVFVLACACAVSAVVVPSVRSVVGGAGGALLLVLSSVTFRSRAISALHALVTSAPDDLRERLRTLPLARLLHTCAGLRDSSRRSVAESATVLAMRSTARRCTVLRAGGRRTRGPTRPAGPAARPRPITDASVPRLPSPSSAAPHPSKRRRGRSPGTD